MTTRRQILKSGCAAGLAVLGASPVLGIAREAAHATSAERPHLAAPIEAAAWIQRARVVTPHGITWPADPQDSTFDPLSPDTQTLYSHSPGVVLFLLELYHATGDPAFLKEARAGADHLAASLASHERTGPTGLYEGMAGIAYTLELTHQVSGHARYRRAAAQYIAAIQRRAKLDGAGGADWGESNDIVSGAAGTGLTLLWWARTVRDPKALALAAKSGRLLLRRAEPTAEGGQQWRMATSYPKLMPNFSHGTAGIAYFLASLHMQTRERAFLAAAEAGARHLQAITTSHDGGSLICHHLEADGTPSPLYYLSWCHGPVGTWRLFHRLSRVTKNAEWSRWVHQGARGILMSGIPEQRTPGFWNNVSPCCGNAGVARGFLDLHRAYGNPEYLAFAERVTLNLMQRATRDATGLRWVQAENRTEPENLVAQTGFMQGAAGIGTWLLQLDGFQHGRKPLVTLPDSPFGV